MKTIQVNNSLPFLVIILCCVIKSSHQTNYPCNASASCGCSTNPAVVTRIVGGQNAASATWGWAVSVSIAGNYLCGGSIISSSWVMTAAHCVNGYKASQITIYAGSTQQFTSTQRSVGSHVIVHPNYNPSNYVNDIALILLASPLSMSDPFVSAICLPSVSSSTLAAGEWPPVNTSLVAVGWGTLSSGGPLPGNLQQVTLLAIAYNSAMCTTVLANSQVQFCAGQYGGGKDTCQGDSGGPLMMFDSSGRWILVGLTSNGQGCALPSFAGVYTRVAAFQDWISATMSATYSHQISIYQQSILVLLVSLMSTVLHRYV